MKCDAALPEWVFLTVFFITVFLIPMIVVWATYNKNVKFDVSTLWVHNDRIDKFAVIIMFTWWVHTCSMILWALMRTITTADYATYVAWAIPIIAKMYAPSNGGPPK